MPGPVFWWGAAAAGTILPWTFFASYFVQNGLSPVHFLLSLFENGAAAGFSVDVMLSILVFWIWSFFDARREGVARWWLTLPAGFCVGLSLALPVYLAMRESRSA